MKQHLSKDIKISLKQNAGEFGFSLTDLPYLADHAFQGMIVLPGSAYIEMAIVIYNQLFNKIPGVITDVNFKNIILLSDKETRIAFEIDRKSDEELKIKFAEKTESENLLPGVSPATSLSVKRDKNISRSIQENLNISDFQEKASIKIQSEKFYRNLSENGNQYGPKFQNIKEIWISEDEALGKLSGTSSEMNSTGEHFLHPSLLDSSTQCHYLLQQFDFSPF